MDLDPGLVLREAGDLSSAIDLHAELADPGGEDALDVLLPQRQAVVVARRKVADVEAKPRKPIDLGHLALGEEPIGDSALVEDLDGARLQSTRARAGALLAHTPFDDGGID